MSKEKTTEKEKELTPEELTERRTKTLTFYKDKSEVLAHQCNCEELTARIEEARLRQMMAIMQQAELMKPQDPGQPGEGSGTKRQLKKD